VHQASSAAPLRTKPAPAEAKRRAGEAGLMRKNRAANCAWARQLLFTGSDQVSTLTHELFLCLHLGQ
jgi:hypothetical protein